MRKEEKSILIGACIGDGYLWKDPNSKSVSLVLKHSINQKEYLLHKVNMLRSILGGSENKIVEFNNSGYLGIRWSKSSKYFRIIRKWLYKNNKVKGYTNRVKETVKKNVDDSLDNTVKTNTGNPGIGSLDPEGYFGKKKTR